MECLEPYLDGIHLQKVDSAFQSPVKRAGGKSAQNGSSGAKIRLSAVDLLSKSGIDFFGTILTAKHYM